MHILKLVKIILLLHLFSHCLCVPYFRTDDKKIRKALISVIPTENLDRHDNITWLRLPNIGSYAYDSHEMPIIGSVVEPSYRTNELAGKSKPSKYGCPIQRRGRRYKDKSLLLVYEPPTEVKHWVAVVASGRCMLQDKITTAYNAGAAGLLFYHSGNELKYFRRINYRKSPFVVVGTTQVNYKNISNLIAAGLTVKIEPGDTHYPRNGGTVLYFFFGSLLTVTSLICLSICCPWPINISIPNIPADMSYWIRSNNNNFEMMEVCLLDIAECCICLESFGKTEKVVRLGCQHIFHKDCIRKWAKSSQFQRELFGSRKDPTCPICYRKIFPSASIYRISTHKF